MSSAVSITRESVAKATEVAVLATQAQMLRFSKRLAAATRLEGYDENTALILTDAEVAELARIWSFNKRHPGNLPYQKALYEQNRAAGMGFNRAGRGSGEWFPEYKGAQKKFMGRAIAAQASRMLAVYQESESQLLAEEFGYDGE